MTPPQRIQHVSSGGLSVLVHGILMLGLMVGISWKNPPQLPIEADLWSDLPSYPAAAAPPPIIAQPVQPAPPPEPLRKVEAAPTVPDQAEIALKKAEKKRAEAQHREEEQQQAELLRLKEKQQAEKALADKVLAENKLAEEKRAEEILRVEQVAKNQRLENERIEKEKREQSRRQVDQELARQMREELESENAQLRNLQNAARANRQARVVKDFQVRIRDKIKDALILPRNLKGDAEVVFQVSLLPNGEVIRVTLLRTSGQPLYDTAVERAIFKSSPLPLPAERDVAAKFRDGLTLKFRPSEDAFQLQ